jgi:hypothetical protein
MSHAGLQLHGFLEVGQERREYEQVRAVGPKDYTTRIWELRAVQYSTVLIIRVGPAASEMATTLGAAASLIYNSRRQLRRSIVYNIG